MSYIGQDLRYGRPERFVYTATGGETSITTADNGNSISYSIGYADVYLNGVRLIAGTDYTATTGSSITGLAALTASDIVEVVAHRIISGVDSVSQQNGGSFYGAVTFADTATFNGNTAVVINGDLTVTGTTTTVNSATAQTIDLGDNDKIQLGTGNDLQLYHDGSNSLINDNGTGTLQLQTGGSTKLTVTSTGIDVTGVAVTDGVTSSDNVAITGTLATGNTAITGTANITGLTTLASTYATGQVYPRVVSMTDGATITPNFANGNFFSVTLGDNRVLANPTNAQPGQVGSIFVTQDGTGNRTLSFGVNWHWPAATAPTLSTSGGAVDRIDYVVYAANAVHAVATLDNRNS